MYYQIFNSKTGAFEGNNDLVNPRVGEEFTMNKTVNKDNLGRPISVDVIRYKIESILENVINAKEIAAFGN